MTIQKVNIWTGVATFEAYAIVYRNSSWVNQSFMCVELLDYFQLQYDISNFIAKQPENETNSKRINAENRRKISKIFYSYVDKLNNGINQIWRPILVEILILLKNVD